MFFFWGGGVVYKWAFVFLEGASIIVDPPFAMEGLYKLPSKSTYQEHGISIGNNRVQHLTFGNQYTRTDPAKFYILLSFS